MLINLGGGFWVDPKWVKRIEPISVHYDVGKLAGLRSEAFFEDGKSLLFKDDPDDLALRVNMALEDPLQGGQVT